MSPSALARAPRPITLGAGASAPFDRTEAVIDSGRTVAQAGELHRIVDDRAGLREDRLHPPL
jgi:hypothetical protein